MMEAFPKFGIPTNGKRYAIEVIYDGTGQVIGWARGNTEEELIEDANRIARQHKESAAG